MADRKITDLTALAAGSQATGDLLTIVDVSEAAATDKNKKITVESLFKGIPSNVGIGTASPASKAHIKGGSLTVEHNSPSTGTGQFNINSESNSQVSLSYDDQGHISIGTASAPSGQTGFSEKVRIDSSGNVGINKSSPSYKLEVDGGSNTAARFTVDDSSPGIAGLITTNGANADIEHIIYTSKASIGSSVNIPIAFHTNGKTNEKMRLDTSGRLLVGTTTEGQANADNLTVADSADCGITIRSGTTSQGALFFSDATSGTGEYDGFITYDQSTRAMRFGTATGEQIRIDSSGRLALGTTTPVRDFHNANGVCLTTGAAPQYRLNGGAGDSNDNDRAIFGLATANNHFVSGAVAGDAILRTTNGGNLLFGVGTTERMRLLSGGGLTFNGDTAAANALDDYEEGTWTPTFSSGVTSPTYTSTTGGYTKIGKLVTFTLRMDAGGTTNSNQARIAGLPFTSNSGNIQGGGTFNYAGNIVGNADGLPTLHVPANTTEIRFYFNSGANFNGNSGGGVLGTLHIHGFYYTA